MPIRGPELSPQLRSRICELYSLSYSYSFIAEKHQIPKSTVARTCRLEAARVNNTTRSRPGAPRKVTAEQRDHIYDTISHTNPHIQTPDLLKEVDYTVKKRALQYLCRELGRRKWKQRRRPEIKPEHAVKRLEWARSCYGPLLIFVLYHGWIQLGPDR